MPAPTLVISVTQHERTPVCPLKNSNAPLAIFVLPIDLRSFILRGVLNEFLINPMAPIVAPQTFPKTSRPVIDRRGTRTVRRCHASAQVGGGLRFCRL